LLPFGITDSEFALVTFVSAFIGITLVVSASRLVRTRYLAAFAFGVYLWYFTDTLADANYLNVNSGFVYSEELLVLFLLFAVGLVLFFSLDGKLFTADEPLGRYGMLVAALAALALGLHGFGEGADFGTTASATPFNTLLDAFGGVSPSASWVLHKMLEPTVAAVCYVAFADSRTKKWADRLVDVLALSVIFVTPAIVGSVVGYYVTFDHTYVFALGLGASIYAVARVGKALYKPDTDGKKFQPLKVAIAIAIGFLLIFMSALLHS